MRGIDAAAEKAIEEACVARDYSRATTRAFEAYGPEILSFLAARLRADSDAEEAFSMFAEDLCKALPGFELRCSVRGYLYTLARNAANRQATAPHRRQNRNAPLTGNASALAVIDRARTETQLHRRTDVKDKVRALREQLSPDDQMLLTLHIDRALPWREVALVMHEQSETLDDPALDREAARIRKRFERVKADLRRLAEEAGLLQR